MGCRRLGRPPVKSTKALAGAKLAGEAKFYKSKQGREAWTRAQVERMIDKIDPLELLAVGASTFIVYDIIKSTPEMLAQAKSFVLTPPFASAIPFIALIYDRIWGDATLTDEQKAQFKAIQDEADFPLFVKSFAIAYILVKHSGQIISGVGNVTGMIAGFLGLKVV